MKPFRRTGERYTLRLALCRYVDLRCAGRVVARARRLPGVAAARGNVAGHQITLWLRNPTEESVICLNEAFSSVGWRVAAANLQAGWIGQANPLIGHRCPGGASTQS